MVCVAAISIARAFTPRTTREVLNYKSPLFF
jgi:hypothetical protein